MHSDFSFNSKHLTIAGRNTADFSVFPPGADVFFAKKDLPGVHSKIGGILKKKNPPRITQRFYAHFGQIWRGGNSEGITVN